MYFIIDILSILYDVGSSLGALSGGRVGIIFICVHFISIAVTIAVRYCAVRKQFGPTENNELPVIEYQTQVCITTEYLFRAK